MFRRRGKSAMQKYVLNKRRLAMKLHEHYQDEKENEEVEEEVEEIPAKKSKPTPKPKAKPMTKINQTPKVKRSKKVPQTPEIHPSDEQTMEANLISMPDDCIREIFIHLDATDLCSLSTQCRRLRSLTEYELFRRFPNESAKIATFEQNGYWFHYPGADKFLVCFAQFRKLSINNSLKNVQAIENLYEFIRAKKQSRVDEIYFKGCRQIRPQHGKALAKIVEVTKSVTFNKTKITGEFYKSILCHFPAMENLVLQNSLQIVCDIDKKNHWLKEEYPHLKDFSWFLDDEIHISDEVKMFFDLNKNIEHFSLYTKKIETVEQCEQKGIKITHLYFRITHDVEQKLKYLKTICQKNESLQLHLMFQDECRSQLTSNMKLFNELKLYLRGLYLDGSPPTIKLAKVIAESIYLKNLQLRHCKFIDSFAGLPELENLYVSRGMVEPTCLQIKNMMFQFATRAPNLKNLFFRNSCLPFRDFGFDLFNIERSKLEGATKMTIHVRTKSKERIAELSNMQVNYDMFNIKITDPEEPELVNPLVTDWLYTH